MSRGIPEVDREPAIALRCGSARRIEREHVGLRRLHELDRPHADAEAPKVRELRRIDRAAGSARPGRGRIRRMRGRDRTERQESAACRASISPGAGLTLPRPAGLMAPGRASFRQRPGGLRPPWRAHHRDAGRTTCAALPAQPVDRVVPEDIRRRLMSLPMPEQGLAPDEMLEFLRREILPWPIAIGHRRSYGWVNSPPAPISILADAVATTMNCGLDGYDHSALFLMSSVGRWIMELVGFPAEGSLCLLLTGGSAATLNALTAARHRAAEQAGWNLRAEGLQGGRARLVLYASAESHSSIQKCVEQLGIGTDNLRQIPVDETSACGPTPCARAIEATGRRATCRSPSSPAAARRTRARSTRWMRSPTSRSEFGIWLHVDGAFGAWAALDPAYAARFAGRRARGLRHAQSAQVAAGAARLRRAADAAPRRASRGFLADARLPRRRAQRGALALRAHVPAHLRQSRAEDLGRPRAAGAQRA